MSRRITSEFGTLAERTHHTATGQHPAPDQQMSPPDTALPDTALPDTEIPDAEIPGTALPGAEPTHAGQHEQQTTTVPNDTPLDTPPPAHVAPETTPEELVAAARLQDPVHVWIDGHCAGLLLAWSQGPDRTWWGRVFWCPPELPEAALDWISQQRLHPAR